MRVTSITPMKDEGPFVLEWLAYHRLIGVNDPIVFTNHCNDGTDMMLERLDEMGLISSIDLQVQYANGKVNTITGLNTIDEGKLNTFGGETLEEFQKNGYLLAIHALLVSSFQLNAMIKRQGAGDEAVIGVKLEAAKDRTAA